MKLFKKSKQFIVIKRRSDGKFKQLIKFPIEKIAQISHSPYGLRLIIKGGGFHQRTLPNGCYIKDLDQECVIDFE